MVGLGSLLNAREIHAQGTEEHVVFAKLEN